MPTTNLVIEFLCGCVSWQASSVAVTMGGVHSESKGLRMFSRRFCDENRLLAQKSRRKFWRKPKRQKTENHIALRWTKLFECLHREGFYEGTFSCQLDLQRNCLLLGYITAGCLLTFVCFCTSVSGWFPVYGCEVSTSWEGNQPKDYYHYCARLSGEVCRSSLLLRCSTISLWKSEGEPSVGNLLYKLVYIYIYILLWIHITSHPIIFFIHWVFYPRNGRRLKGRTLNANFTDIEVDA